MARLPGGGGLFFLQDKLPLAILSALSSAVTVWAQQRGGTIAGTDQLPLVLRFSNAARGKQEVIEWKNGHGETLQGVLLKPVGYQEGKRYPLIVGGYPAQPDGFKAATMMGNQLWAAQGYAVFWPAARSPHTWMDPYRDPAFDEAAQGPKGVEVLVDDVMSGVDAVIRRGVADPERMGLHGFNGGGVVGYLVTQTNRFRCAVWASGVYPGLDPAGHAQHRFDAVDVRGRRQCVGGPADVCEVIGSLSP